MGSRGAGWGRGADLAADHTVIVPDLRGYGDSSKPEANPPEVYAKRTMGAQAFHRSVTS